MLSYSRRVDIPGKSAQELYDAVAKGVDQFLAKVPIGSYEVDKRPGDQELEITASMFNAILIFKEGAIELEAKLSILAAPFRRKLDEGIDYWLAKTFPPTKR